MFLISVQPYCNIRIFIEAGEKFLDRSIKSFDLIIGFGVPQKIE